MEPSNTVGAQEPVLNSETVRAAVSQSAEAEQQASVQQQTHAVAHKSLAQDPQAPSSSCAGLLKRVDQLEKALGVRSVKDALLQIPLKELLSDHQKHAPFWRAAFSELLYLYGIDGWGDLVAWMAEKQIENLTEDSIWKYCLTSAMNLDELVVQSALGDVMIRLGRLSFLVLGCESGQCGAESTTLSEPHPRAALLQKSRAYEEQEAPSQLRADTEEATRLLRSGAWGFTLNENLHETKKSLFFNAERSANDTITVLDLIRSARTDRSFLHTTSIEKEKECRDVIAAMISMDNAFGSGTPSRGSESDEQEPSSSSSDSYVGSTTEEYGSSADSGPDKSSSDSEQVIIEDIFED